MDAFLTLIYGALVIGVLVVIHEAGHYIAARVFGVRVTEFMIGLPGPRIGVMWHGTRFGVTAVPLGGYARVCGMEAGEESPYLAKTLEMVFHRGEVLMEDVSRELGISDDEAYRALDQLSEWGTIAGPRRSDKYNIYRTLPTQSASTRTHIARGTLLNKEYAEGEPRALNGDAESFIALERAEQYRSLPFWKRSVILLAGPLVNLVFALVVFIIMFSVVGMDVANQQGELVHVVVDPLRALAIGLNYIGMVAASLVNLFNPLTAVDTVSNSSSIVGVAVMSKAAVDEGITTYLMFMAMISVSLGAMNMLPIPPLDGGRFIVEVYQKIRGRLMSPHAVNRLSLVGMSLFGVLFVVLVGQDIMRIFTGTFGV